MRAYRGAVSNTKTAQPTTSNHPTTAQEAAVTQTTTNQPEGFKDVYAASLAIEMTSRWAYSMDPRTAPLIEVQAAAAHLSQLPISEDVTEMFRRVMRCQELEGAFWERRYRGEGLM